MIANAVRVMRISTGEETDELTSDGKNATAVQLEKKRGPYKKSVEETSN